MKKRIIAVIAILTLTLTFALFPGGTALAASWQDIYADILYAEPNKINYYRATTFSIHDLNSDGVPELFTDGIYTFSNGKAVKLSDYSFDTAYYEASIGIPKDPSINGVFLSLNGNGWLAAHNVEYMYMRDGQILEEHWGDYGNENTDDYDLPPDFHYYFKGKEVSAAEYERAIDVIPIEFYRITVENINNIIYGGTPPVQHYFKASWLDFLLSCQPSDTGASGAPSDIDVTGVLVDLDNDGAEELLAFKVRRETKHYGIKDGYTSDFWSVEHTAHISVFDTENGKNIKASFEIPYLADSFEQVATVYLSSKNDIITQNSGYEGLNFVNIYTYKNGTVSSPVWAGRVYIQDEEELRNGIDNREIPDKAAFAAELSQLGIDMVKLNEQFGNAKRIIWASPEVSQDHRGQFTLADDTARILSLTASKFSLIRGELSYGIF